MSSPKPTSTLAQKGSPKQQAQQAPAAAKVASSGKLDKQAAKAAKQARRAAAKGVEPGQQQQQQQQLQSGPSTGASALQGPSSSGGQGGGKQQQHGRQNSASLHQQQPQQAASGSRTGTASSQLAKGQDPSAAAGLQDPLQPFLHLDSPSNSALLRHSSKSSTANIHPSIIRLALQYAEFKVVGANARCIAMLEAFKDVIASYNPPPQTNLTRHLPTTHLNPQIGHLIRARPLSVSMGTAIRYLKYEISLIDQEMDVDEAKALLLVKIDSFIRDRILLAGKVIEQHAIDKIKNGDTILTYARSSVVEGVLLEARRQGKRFSVIVVDSRPLHEGKHLLTSLRSLGISTSYVLLPSLSLILPRVSLCLLGTHALLSNGSMFSRAGTAMVAMMLKERGVPVVCCCETYKFSERIMLDSIVGNERASSTSLLEGTGLSTANSSLSPLSLLYDVSRPEDVTVVITEAGLIPVQSVPVLLRDYKPLAGGVA
ncbi:hypothetical protein OIO90_004881 [Microbotryomycetes sp. JL221]|nr:hypothetical protein OIO90_004881 [Microbotryomycetes sp. JL221]